MDKGVPSRSLFPDEVRAKGENAMGIILFLILIILIIGLLPAWPYSSGWGYYPSGGAGLLLVILLIFLLMGLV